MRSFDGAEVCELVGTYILRRLNTVFENKNMGLYRDNGVGIFRNLSGPEIEKKMIKQRTWVINNNQS